MRNSNDFCIDYYMTQQFSLYKPWISRTGGPGLVLNALGIPRDNGIRTRLNK